MKSLQLPVVLLLPKHFKYNPLTTAPNPSTINEGSERSGLLSMSSPCKCKLKYKWLLSSTGYITYKVTSSCKLISIYIRYHFQNNVFL